MKSREQKRSEAEDRQKLRDARSSQEQIHMLQMRDQGHCQEADRLKRTMDLEDTREPVSV